MRTDDRVTTTWRESAELLMNEFFPRRDENDIEDVRVNEQVTAAERRMFSDRSDDEEVIAPVRQSTMKRRVRSLFGSDSEDEFIASSSEPVKRSKMVLPKKKAKIQVHKVEIWLDNSNVLQKYLCLLQTVAIKLVKDNVKDTVLVKDYLHKELLATSGNDVSDCFWEEDKLVV
ncbi:hypothetical protein CBL_12336 [Carabus blaptoides fortunei]